MNNTLAFVALTNKCESYWITTVIRDVYLQFQFVLLKLRSLFFYDSLIIPSFRFCLKGVPSTPFLQNFYNQMRIVWIKKRISTLTTEVSDLV